MTKYTTKLLICIIATISIVSFSNLLIIYWLPIKLPLSSFSCIRLMVFAIIEKQYYLIFVSFIICVIFMLTALSIYKKSILFPVILFLYLLYDFIIVMLLLINNLKYGYWVNYISHTIVLLISIILLCVYFVDCAKDRFNKNTKENTHNIENR